MRSCSAGVGPARRPWSRSVWRTQPRRVSGAQPILAAIELIAAACEACSPWWSNTIRTARARTSGEYGGICLVMAPSFQDQEPPENPVRFRALPFLSVLAPSERYATERGQRHKKLTDWARQVLLQTARWLPGRRVVAVGDSSFSAIELLRDVSRHLCMISRLRLDAGLYEPAPPRKPGTLGRPRVKGARLPSLLERLADPATAWRWVSIDGWYGRAERRLHIASGTALWHHPGMQVPIRWVLVRDPSDEKEPQAFLCTDLDADPVDILRWFVRRWRVETTFEEARRHLGLETQRQWSDLAILRTTPALLGLFSLVTLWATQLEAAQGLLPECVRWYPKHAPTFSDVLARVRRELWSSPTFAASPDYRDVPKLSADVLNRLLLIACRPP